MNIAGIMFLVAAILAIADYVVAPQLMSAALAVACFGLLFSAGGVAL